VAERYGDVIQGIAGDSGCDTVAAAALALSLSALDRSKVGSRKIFPGFQGRDKAVKPGAKLSRRTSFINFRRSSQLESTPHAAVNPMYVHKPLGDYGRTPEKALDGISAEVDRIIAGLRLGADGGGRGTDVLPPPSCDSGEGDDWDGNRKEEEEEEEEEEDNGDGDVGGVWRASSAEMPADLQSIMSAAHEHLDLFEYSCRSRDVGTSHGSISENAGLAPTPCFEGCLLLVQIVAANFRRICNPSAKVTALLLLVRLGYHSSNSDILRRILPVVVLAFHDELPTIRVMGIRAARSLTSCVTGYTSFESNIYSSYLFQELTPLSKDSEITVRVAFAQSICHFAKAAKHCLELGCHSSFSPSSSFSSSSSFSLPAHIYPSGLTLRL